MAVARSKSGRSHRPVAVVGFAYRLPGVGAADLWEALSQGEDLVTAVAPERFSQARSFHPNKHEPGCSYTFAAGSVGDIAGFDAAFFGISPREAEQMDPQQRMLLEMSWEAFESGGIKPSTFKGSKCAVFIGYSGSDYSYRRADDLAALDASSMTGNTGSIAANRISYFYDLRGPSMAVDTACSSSLVAMHQACQSIRANEVDQAITGAICLHAHPFAFVGFSKASMLSPRGVCNVFDASGDGYVRAEGGGIFILKDLEKALADGDQVFAVIAGSGVNCDGKTNGLTVPDSNAQAALLREVYEQAGISPRDVDYLEAHGTGTAVGDPIEAHSIGEALGRERPEQSPLLIGSVKSNVGHLETASGVAGMVKALYCLKHRSIPPTIHVKHLNPNIDFDAWNIRVVTANTPLAEDKKLVVGVNSFGFGGANAHVVLESFEQVSKSSVATVVPDCAPLVLSAQSPAALRASAKQWSDYLNAHPERKFYDLAYAALLKRELLEYRAVVYADSRQSAIAVLKQYAQGEPSRKVAEGVALADASSPVFVYSGNGSQWVGMGQRLIRESRVFRDAVTRVDALFQALSGFSIVEELSKSEGEDRLDLTEVAQPTLFAMQVGMTELLLHMGAAPGAVVGHSVGEVAAAWACGALSLEQAVCVIFERSRQQEKTKGDGGMTAVGVAAAQTLEILTEIGLRKSITVAGVNSPRGVTLAGDTAVLRAVEDALTDREIFHRRLPLDYAFHSPAMDAIEQPLKDALADLEPGPDKIPLFSTVSGGRVSGQELNAEYWWANIREPVRFEGAIRELAAAGFNLFVEIGPHAVLRNYVADCLRDESREGQVLTTMVRDDDSLDRIKGAFYQLLMAGAPIETQRLFPVPGRFVDIPRYAWQHEPYWLESTVECRTNLNDQRAHPLLGYRLAEHAYAWESRLDTQLFPEYADHVVGEAVVFPAAGFVEMALAAAAQWQPGDACELEDLEIRAPLLLEHERSKLVRLRIDERDGSFEIESRDRLSRDPWLSNVVGRLLGKPLVAPLVQFKEPPSYACNFTAHDHYQLTDKVGLSYGPGFRTVEKVWLTDSGVIATLTEPATASKCRDYRLHPAFLDGCFQLLVDLLAEEISDVGSPAFVPIKVNRLVLLKPVATPAYGSAVLVQRSPRSMVVRFDLFDCAGELVAVLDGVRFRALQLRRNVIEQTDYLRNALIPAPHGGLRAATVGAVIDKLWALHGDGNSGLESLPENARYAKEVAPLIDVLCAAFAQRALRRLAPADGGFGIDTLMRRHAIAVEQVALLQYMLNILEEDGVLEPTVDGVRWTGDVVLPDPEDIWVDLLGDYPDYAAEFLMIGRAGLHLDDILTGRLAAESFVPDPNESATLFQYVSGSPVVRAAYRAVSDIVTRVIDGMPREGRVRILEIGTVTSRLGAHLWHQIPFSRCDYVLAGSSQEVFDFHQDLLEKFPCVDSHLVDFEQPVSDLAGEFKDRFDIVIASHMLSKSRDHERVLANVRETMAPNALLVLLESRPSRWSDLVFGLNPAWWDESQWRETLFGQVSTRHLDELLSGAGFDQTRHISDRQSGVPQILISRATQGPAQVGMGTNETAPARLVLLIDPQDGYGSALAKVLAGSLAEAGHRVVHLYAAKDFAALTGGYSVDLRSSKQLQRAFSAVAKTYATVDDVVYLGGIDADLEFESAQRVLARQVDKCAIAANLLQALEQSGTTPRVWLVTAGAPFHELIDGETVTARGQPIADASLWGFGRTLMNEYPGIPVKLVGLAALDQLERMSTGLLEELSAPDDEDEIVYTEMGRFVTRVVPAEAGLMQAQPEVRDEATWTKLDFSFPGPLKNLFWRTDTAPALAAADVEIEVRAAGLNFRDVMYAMGLLSDEAVERGFAGPTLGMELSGVIKRIGPEVHDLAVGDEVIAFAPASFATHAVTTQSAVVRKPPEWSFAAAATVPTTFFTAYYALHHLARLQPGERVLIHGAAGGVGIAAIQLAHHLGAEIFATAGSDEKRDFVGLLGADHVMDSRSLAFADEILDVTQGEGVDVVLNSLAGEAINRNLKVLKPFGRFLELGKRDYYENTKVGLRPFRNNVSYFGIDADQLMAERPALTRQLFVELMQLFENGQLKPLPYRAFAASEAIDAFRYMQQSKQIGKVVLTFDEPPVSKKSAVGTKQPLQLPADATYLVVGGLSGFGAKTALWLADKGARHLALVSRSGEAGPEIQQALEGLRGDGVTIKQSAFDVTDTAAMAQLFDEIENELPPLRGVIHAAMVVADKLVRNMDAGDLEKVFAPKMVGAMNLHELTKRMPLDFFVLYSSATTFFGNPGQANYVGANMFLEALAQARRDRGLPAICVSWGAISDVGYLARNEEIKASLESRMGGAALKSAEALEVLEQLIVQDRSGLGVLDYGWSALQRFLPSAAAPKFSVLALQSDEGELDAEGLIEIQRWVQELSAEELTVLFVDLLKKEVGEILRIPPDKLDEHRSVFDLGMDSLMGMELVSAVEARFGVNLPIMALSEGPTIARLVERIVAQLKTPGSDVEETGSLKNQVQSTAIQHGGEVDDEFIDEITANLSDAADESQQSALH